jgi:hypothetical protein
MPDPLRRFPRAMAGRQDRRRLCRRRRQLAGARLPHSSDNEAEARQAKVLTKDEARRAVIIVPRLPELLGKADRG